ncbi:hypothetical protein AJ79_06757 [Helicocarpus griseus UAMH5409]|uniref:UBL3-like ubiquitin domain-containing protein n=1 Tax=Helicocarpus griseus UAMH5409 TaxID=1447875 RepID=A0A2B7X9N5_9EURO|nr:hypothetical protein AJ79_06757 [Helicocarpus griseus UAMH5409]
MASNAALPERGASLHLQPSDSEKMDSPDKSSSIPQDPPVSTTSTTTASAPAPESTATASAVDPSHPPATAKSTEHSDPPGTSTTVGENTLASGMPASQPPPAVTTTANGPPQQQTQSTALSPSETRESKPSDPAIGPSSDLPSPASKEAEDSGMVLVINLLLITGARHPFKIDGKYLRKRQVNVPDYNPYAMSVYTLKELIWKEWRSEWEPRPSSPSSIRLISFGKLLDDKAPLSDMKFSHTSPNVLHMTLKPQEVVDEEDAKAARSSSGRERDGGDPSPRCRCVIL